MPPPRRQSGLRTPLNTILGAEANVRLLRELVLAESPLPASELARRAKLGRTSVYPALAVLEAAGIVSSVGAGARGQIRLRRRHPLASSIVSLFRIEAERVTAFIDALRAAFRSMEPQPMSAWLEGLDAEQTEPSASALAMYVVGDPRTLPQLSVDLVTKLAVIEKTFDVVTDLHTLTRSELATRSPGAHEIQRDVVLLAGVPPTGLFPGLAHLAPTSSEPSWNHERHDARARQLAVAIAAKVRRNPALIRRARRHLESRAASASPRERRELEEWIRILDTMPSARLQRFLVESSERATRLRQSLPALGILTAREREAALASVPGENEHAVAKHARRRGKRRAH